MFKIIYSSNTPYTAFIGSEAVKMLGAAARQAVAGASIAVVTDDGVPDEHVDAACSQLEAAGFNVDCFSLPKGEANKNLNGVKLLYGFFYDIGLTRSDAVVAVGGGVVGDMAGFAAATYLRGVAFINVPTTMISQTDSAYGGKTGVDFGNGKNYIGSFYDPASVICDTDFLKTLPREQLLCGMGEVIKYGAIADESLLSAVQINGAVVPEDGIIARCADIKRTFVEGDEHDKGKRRILNFGHTIGHAIEADSGYSVPHGQAVAYGMLAAARIGQNLGITEASVYPRLFRAADACGLDTDWQPKAAASLPLIALDKKSNGSAIDMVLLKKIGEPVIVPIETNAVKELMIV